MGGGEKIPFSLQFNPKVRLENHDATIHRGAGVLHEPTCV